MIAVPAGVRVLVATKPVDFRRGADSLAALAREELQRDPFSGVIIVFRSKRADRLKILAWDGTGLVLYWNYLTSYCSSFSWKRAHLDSVVRPIEAARSTSRFHRLHCLGGRFDPGGS